MFFFQDKRLIKPKAPQLGGCRQWTFKWLEPACSRVEGWSWTEEGYGPFDRTGRKVKVIKVICSGDCWGQLFPLPTNCRQATVHIRPSIQSRHTPAVPSPVLTAWQTDGLHIDSPDTQPCRLAGHPSALLESAPNISQRKQRQEERGNVFPEKLSDNLLRS